MIFISNSCSHHVVIEIEFLRWNTFPRTPTSVITSSRCGPSEKSTSATRTSEFFNVGRFSYRYGTERSKKEYRNSSSVSRRIRTGRIRRTEGDDWSTYHILFDHSSQSLESHRLTDWRGKWSTGSNGPVVGSWRGSILRSLNQFYESNSVCIESNDQVLKRTVPSSVEWKILSIVTFMSTVLLFHWPNASTWLTQSLFNQAKI